MSMYSYAQSLRPKGNIVRTDITSVEHCPDLHDKENVFSIGTKSNDKWQVAAVDEVCVCVCMYVCVLCCGALYMPMIRS